MRRPPQRLEALLERGLLMLCAGVIAVLSVLESIFGLHQKWMEPLMPSASLVLSILILRMVMRQQDQTERLAELLNDIQTNSFGQARVDSELELIFGDYIRRLLNDAVAAVRERKVHLPGTENLRPYFDSTFKAHPKGQFYALSIASEVYFWRPNAYERSLRDFIDHGGSIERIFFVEDCPERLSPEEQRVIAKHQELGVNVLVVSEKALAPEFRRLLLVESTGKIGWESEINLDKSIKKTLATSDSGLTRSFLETYQRVRSVAIAPAL